MLAGLIPAEQGARVHAWQAGPHTTQVQHEKCVYVARRGANVSPN